MDLRGLYPQHLAVDSCKVHLILLGSYHLGAEGVVVGKGRAGALYLEAIGYGYTSRLPRGYLETSALRGF